jgi:tRNA G10  N-methylase Trm11
MHRGAYSLASLHKFSAAFCMSLGNADVLMSLLLQDMFDAIICDPPYGVRAGGKKSVAKSHKVTCAETHIPSTDAYTFEECLRDLLHLAAKHLKLGGRLVFFQPSVPGVDKAGFSIPCRVLFHLHTERRELLVSNHDSSSNTQYSWHSSNVHYGLQLHFIHHVGYVICMWSMHCVHADRDGACRA